MSDSLSTSVSTLIAAVQTADSAPKLVKAVQALAAERSPDAIPTLIAALSYNNPGAAVASVDGLIALGEASVPPLLTEIDQHNYTARAWAIRALAGIGDPRALVTLLGVATADFALSVRRAAAKGLGTMQWAWFPPQVLEMAQTEVLEALSFVAQQDEEWIVRYAAIVGLQSFAAALPQTSEWRSEVEKILTTVLMNDARWAVQARAQVALEAVRSTSSAIDAATPSPSPLSDLDWQHILDTLYARKGEERTVFAAGDPRQYRSIAMSLSSDSTPTRDDSV